MEFWIAIAAGIFSTCFIAIFGYLWRRESNRNAEAIAALTRQMADLAVRTSALERTSAPTDLLWETRASMLASLDGSEQRITKHFSEQIGLLVTLLNSRSQK